MGRLGYDRWGSQGGEWGAAVTTRLGYRVAMGLVGIHLNMVLFQPTGAERADATRRSRTCLAGCSATTNSSRAITS